MVLLIESEVVGLGHWMVVLGRERPHGKLVISGKGGGSVRL